MRTTIGWTPLLSELNREFATRGFEYILRLFLQRMHEGFFSFCLVEESELREFFMPALDYAGLLAQFVGALVSTAR